MDQFQPTGRLGVISNLELRDALTEMLEEQKFSHVPHSRPARPLGLDVKNAASRFSPTTCGVMVAAGLLRDSR
jgi:hypothetical protein